MYDNKVRLSKDVLEKAELIAEIWGLKNARAAVEAVFRKYADDYLHRRRGPIESSSEISNHGLAIAPLSFMPTSREPEYEALDQRPVCEALDELDDLLGL